MARSETIVVTGGAGFIGSTLCDRLIEAGHRVTAIDNLSSGRRENLATILDHDRFTLIEDDVARIGHHAEALRGTSRIYHFAALISGYDSLHDPRAYIDRNLNDLIGILELARDLDDPLLSFASSSTVYGPTEDESKSEEGEARPITVYALSKLAGEHLIRMYADLYGYRHVSLRLFNVYGPRQNPDHPYANVTCKFAHAAAHKGAVKLFGDGEQSRDFVYIDDVVAAFLATAEAPRRAHAIYNVGTGREATIASLLAMAQEQAGGALEVERCAPWPNDVRRVRADASRIEGEFDWRAEVELDRGFARTVDFFRDRAAR